tara:strand:+ start:4781 stop:5095 length:315 start_codon:yes stop_codon:yes gene_type:complete
MVRICFVLNVTRLNIIETFVCVMNHTNTSSTLSTSYHDKDGNAATVLLSVVMPVVLLLFCIAYTVWSFERDTRPEKKEQNKSKLSIQPLKIVKIDTKIEVKSKD